MAKTENEHSTFGLIGKNIPYSFSKAYFTTKFSALGLHDCSYENFDLPDIDAFPTLLKNNPNLKGLNVTIPYKEAIIPYLDGIDSVAGKIGAVNTIKFEKKGLVGYNTDIYGFLISLEPHLKTHHQKAFILGTGGASKAVAHVLSGLGITYLFVARQPVDNQLSYDELDQSKMEAHTLIVNCTPLGTYPNIEDKPKIPYQFLTGNHLLFDLIYNPEKTSFLLEGEKRGASICNGQNMLELQAEKAYEIWRS